MTFEVVEPSESGEPLIEFITRRRDSLTRCFQRTGALLFRGFEIDSVERFAAVRAVWLKELAPYVEAATPRTNLGGGVFSSTEFPADQEILLHNENSYATGWPATLAFGCTSAASSGGATPLANVQRVLSRIPASVIREFRSHGGWRLVRNYGEGFGLPWQRAFGTSSRDDLAAYCGTGEISFEWLPGDRLRTWQVRPVLARHVRTRELVWFNHVRFWHPSSLDPELRSMLFDEFGENGLPYNTCYGDGTPIPDEVVAEIAAAYEAEKSRFSWERGDFMLVDNMLVAHGRESFTGDRRVLVSLGDRIARWDCEA